MKYLTNKYLTLRGKIDQIVLPDSTYGEWIVYENNKPKFHVNIFNTESKSDCLINEILTNKKTNFEELIKEINNSFNRNLTLSSKICFGIKLNSKLLQLNLNSLPIEWLKYQK